MDTLYGGINGQYYIPDDLILPDSEDPFLPDEVSEPKPTPHQIQPENNNTQSYEIMTTQEVTRALDNEEFCQDVK